MRLLVLAMGMLVLTAFSGCVGGEGADVKASNPPPSAAPPTVTEDTGSISGTVLDDEALPIVGADVAIIGGGEYGSKTDDGGKFTINEVPPGSVKIVAQKLGFESIGRNVDVLAGEVATVTLTLKAIEIVNAYHDTFDFNGMFVCGVSSPAAVVTPCRNVPEEKSTFAVAVKADVKTYIDAMTWQSSAPGTSKVMRNALSVSPGSGSANMNGPSPNIARVDEIKTKADSKVNHVIWIGYTGTSDPTSIIAISIQQKFHVLTSVFYGVEAPEDYTGLPDG